MPAAEEVTIEATVMLECSSAAQRDDDDEECSGEACGDSGALGEGCGDVSLGEGCGDAGLIVRSSDFRMM